MGTRSVSDLLTAIRQGDESEAHEAALALGLLIEQETVHRPAGEDDGIEAILGKEFARKRLTKAELRDAVDSLLRYAQECPEPHPMAIWALIKSYDPRALPSLLRLLLRTVGDPSREHLSYQALYGVINIGMLTDPERSLSAIRRAAEQGHGSVKETATNYLG